MPSKPDTSEDFEILREAVLEAVERLRSIKPETIRDARVSHANIAHRLSRALDEAQTVREESPMERRRRVCASDAGRPVSERLVDGTYGSLKDES